MHTIAKTSLRQADFPIRVRTGRDSGSGGDTAQTQTWRADSGEGTRPVLGENRDDTIRTCDHLLPKQALYQLSYIPWGVKSSTTERSSGREGSLFDKNLANTGEVEPSGPYPTNGSKRRSKSTKGHSTQEAITEAGPGRPIHTRTSLASRRTSSARWMRTSDIRLPRACSAEASSGTRSWAWTTTTG